MACLNQNHKNDPQDGIIGASFAGKRGEVGRKPVIGLLEWASHIRPHQNDYSKACQEFVRTFANPDTPLHDLIQGNDEAKGDDPG